MKILFKKTDPTIDFGRFTFQGLGISECYVMDLNVSADKASTLRTVHHHAFYEVHIIREGHQEYEIANEKITVSAGELLFITPQTLHLVARETEDYKKYAVNFALAEDSALLPRIAHIPAYAVAKASDALLRLLDSLVGEKTESFAFSESISELLSLECILWVLRCIGATDEGEERSVRLGDPRVAMAKQFIRDNAQFGLSLRDVASYCSVGEKQLSRIFFAQEQCTVVEYIRMQRLGHLKMLLASDAYSIRQISEMMRFSSEYYLNSFFKKHTGMSPGAYRAACRTSAL
jgi:AraC-like DNA-binding protein